MQVVKTSREKFGVDLWFIDGNYELKTLSTNFFGEYVGRFRLCSNGGDVGEVDPHCSGATSLVATLGPTVGVREAEVIEIEPPSQQKMAWDRPLIQQTLKNGQNFTVAMNTPASSN